MPDLLHDDDLRWYAATGMATAPSVIAMARECMRWRELFGVERLQWAYPDAEREANERAVRP